MSGTDVVQHKRILIIMMGGIGNMIFLTPALKALKKALPSVKLNYLLGPYGADKVIDGSSLFDGKILFDTEKKRGIFGKIRLVRELKARDFDLAIVSTGMNPLKSGLLCKLAGIKHRLGEDINGKGYFYNLRISFDKNIHEVDSNIRLVERLGIKVEDRHLYIHHTEDDDLFAGKVFADQGLDGKKVVGMHPGSGIHQAGFKRWPKENFARLADWIINRYEASVFLFGGMEEKDLAEEIKSRMQNSPVIMTGKTTLAQTAALIKKCWLFVSNDSGLLHVASAVNTHSVGIFGPTNPDRTGPYSDSSTLVHKELPCIPCYTGKPVRCDHLDCIRKISVDEVIEKIKDLLVQNGK